jgi:F5/8 type C domain-containing protein
MRRLRSVPAACRHTARRVAFAAFVLAVSGAPLATQPATATSARILDRFDAPSLWQAAASDGVHASVHPDKGPTGPALRLDFDLGGTAGYASAHRALPVDLPPNYEISFYLRSDARVNEFQFKLVDSSGDNVWWFHRPDYEFPREWRLVKIKKRQIEFAWGPTSDRTLRHAATIEFVINAGRGGGGSLYVSDLALRALPPDTATVPTPTAQASSYLPGGEPARALDGDLVSAWTSDPAAGKAQSLTLDFGRAREFGGLVLRWQEHEFASRYDVLFSDDGERWQSVKSVVDGSGGPDALRLPDAETRFVRLALNDGPGDRYSLAEVEIKDLAFGATPNAFITALAREAPRGTYPRGFSGEQPYWTLVGVNGGGETGLLSEDGALEVARGGFSIEPFVVTDGRVATWADVHARPFLVDGYLPLPGVLWRDPRWELRVTAFAAGSRALSRLVARYDLSNRTGKPQRLTLALAIRPFQVNPPTQFLNIAGGVSAIKDIAWDGTALSVDGLRKVFPLRPPARVGAFSFGAGPVPRILAGDWYDTHMVHDDSGFASAVLAYRLVLAPHARQTIGIVVPLSGASAAPLIDTMARGRARSAWLDREERAVAAAWRRKLDRVTLHVPHQAQPLVDTLRTALAHLLITRDGPILRPGTRSYARSWIRDGAMISEALLRLGHADVAADYLRWYAPHQFANGKIPCCVDRRGADPVPENDSPGEFLFLVAEIDRYTHDRALLEAMWPHVESAARYLETLRQSERTEANLAPARRSFYGMLPASISHEGYASKPVHSYWDDFWALKGFDAAQAIAVALGHDAAASRFSAHRDEFRRDLAASLDAAIAAHRIAYLPGSAELGDFDPTSTSIAFAPRGEAQDLPAARVRSTYERYWREFADRRDGKSAWDDYTPYELRNVATFIRLGWRDRAQELLEFFLAGRRPVAWNQWAEVVGREPRQPRFVGDMPHAWVASDFIRSMLDLFAYEREADDALVVAAGVPATWLRGRGIAVEGLRTPYGPLSYSLRQQGSRTLLHLGAGARVPPGGLVFVWPDPQPPRSTRVNGRPANWDHGELRIRELPAEVVVQQ